MIIVHSHNIIQGWPNPEYIARLAEWLRLAKEYKINNILLTGGKATKGIDKRHTDVGKSWMVEQWVDEKRILTEKDPHWSLESVGEMVFARRDHLDLFDGSEEIIVVSSEYHMRRLREIGEFVGWRGIAEKMIFIWVNWDFTPRTEEQEQKSLDAFHSTFAGVPMWDFRAIEERMWREHGLYKNHPSNPYHNQV